MLENIWRPRDIQTEREKWSSCLDQWKGQGGEEAGRVQDRERGRAARRVEGSKAEEGQGGEERGRV